MVGRKKLILIGGGGHCKSCIDVIEQEDKFEIYGILDLPNHVGEKILDYQIIGTDSDIEKYAGMRFSFLITIGQIKSADLRKKAFNKLKILNAEIATIKSPFSLFVEICNSWKGINLNAWSNG